MALNGGLKELQTMSGMPRSISNPLNYVETKYKHIFCGFGTNARLDTSNTIHSYTLTSVIMDRKMIQQNIGIHIF